MIAKSDPKIPEEKRKILRNVLSVLNGFLDSKNWFSGESPTIADFSILSNLIVILVSVSFGKLYVNDLLCKQSY